MVGFKVFMKKIIYLFIALFGSILYFSSCEKDDVLEDGNIDYVHDTIVKFDTVHVINLQHEYDTIYVHDTSYIREIVSYRDTIFHIDTICVKDTIYYEITPPNNFVYPSSKIWYHGANNPTLAAEKSQKFEGLEFDINYSSSTGNLYVCHNIEDTIKGITMEQLFEALPDPASNWYWIDFKNLSAIWADEAIEKIDSIVQKCGVKDHVWIEYFNTLDVQTIKNHGFQTILTVENLYGQSYGEYMWYYYLLGKITEVQPSAIGCDYTMAELLSRYFPNREIFLWHSTVYYTDEYAEKTRQLCRIPSVKVVLVDYDEPITY